MGSVQRFQSLFFAVCSCILSRGLVTYSFIVPPLANVRSPSRKSHVFKRSVRYVSIKHDGSPFSVELNEFFKKPVPTPIKEAFSIFKETDETKLNDDIVSILTAAPGSPGVPRPLWVVILASLPTGLLWYGYYKFAGLSSMNSLAMLFS